MRKGSSENTQADNPWAIGTKASKAGDIEQPPVRKGNQAVPSKPIKHIPKVKDRNPFQALKRLEQVTSEKEITAEINSLLQGFNRDQYNIAEFLAEVVAFMDSYNLTNSGVLEFILTQNETKMYFTELYKSQSQILITALLKSLQANSAFQNKDSCVRMLGHICFEQNEIDNAQIKHMYQILSKIAFENPQALIGISGSSTGASGSSKLSRLAINCIANIVLKQSQFVKENIDSIFLKLKSVFDHFMRKIPSSYKSKRFITTLTTVIRAIQFSMNETNRVVITDTDAVKLFLNFYKLLFLGSPFAEKMLNIKIQEKTSKPIKGTKASQLTENADEELKSDSASFIIDTSDISSSDGGGLGGTSSPRSNDSGNSNDPYAKIKGHAVLCLQHLFKFNNKAIFNQWHLLFPSFLLEPPMEFRQFLYNFSEKKVEYSTKVSQIILREPTLFYLLRSKDNSAKFKTTIAFTIAVLLENSHIQKWQGQMEKEEVQSSQTFSSLSNILVQFLRFLHYQMVYMIDTEKDPAVLSQLVKTSGTLMHITPYGKMMKGLASILIRTLTGVLKSKSQAIVDNQLNQAVINSLQIAFQLADLKEELQAEFLAGQDNLLVYLLQGDAKSDPVKESPETLVLIQRISKNFPHELYTKWEAFIMPYFSRILKLGDRKKLLSVFKILEEWLRNYKSASLLLDDNDEGDENDQHTQRPELIQETPFQYPSFVEMMRRIIDHYFTHKEAPDVNIALLSILSSFDSQQWQILFEKDNYSQKIIDFTFSIKSPPILKANAIKLFGYLVYLDIFNSNPSFVDRLFAYICDNSADTNVNIQMRNSWALANLCCIQKSFQEPQLVKDALKTCLLYAVSTKEKVLSNAVRALGYLLAHTDLNLFDSEVLPDLNKNSQFMAKIGPYLLTSSNETKLTCKSLLRIIIAHIDNKSPKIAWNSCVAIGNIMDNDQTQISLDLFSKEAIKPLINTMAERPNFKTKIHAAQTLMKFKSIETMGGKSEFTLVWDGILKCMEDHNHKFGSQQELRYVQALDKNTVDLWEHISQLTTDQGEYGDMMADYIKSHALTILQVITEYLQKELKVPQYSGMYDETFAAETEALFQENPHLEPKIKKIKAILVKIRDIINSSDKACTSFAVFESIDTLSKTDVKLLRRLEILKIVKSSFNPSFDDKPEGDASQEEPSERTVDNPNRKINKSQK